MNVQDRDKDTRGDELKRALTAIRDLRRKVADLEARSREPVAIIGMACRLPGGADTPERFWDLLRNGVDATSEVPADRWDIDALYDPDPDAPGRVYTRRGGFLQGAIDAFDAAFFGISPREGSAMDPVQRLLLELSWETLERSGIPPQSLEGSDTGVFVGISGSDYDTLQHHSGTLEDIHTYRGTGSAPCVAGGRISYVLGLQGPNLTVDTACSSSLVAIALAVENLRMGRCSLALAGGAHLMLAPDSTVYLCRMRALSPGGRCRTFADDADGYARGEGGGMLALKRLSDAQTDGDPILAVIRGAAFNHDGRSSGLTVPNPVAQRAVIRAALQDAGLSPQSIDYVEAHGTGTPLGDPIEVRALADVLGRHREQDRPLRVGSVKTNFGHLEGASGVAGLMKLVLSLQHAQLPPHLHCERPTSHIDWHSTPVRVNTSLTPWPTDERPRAGGVSAFGFSGTNAHIILEAAPVEEARAAVQHPAELITLSGRTPAAVRGLAQQYADELRSDPGSLADLALTTVVARSPLTYRAAIAATDAEDMARALDDLVAAGDGVLTQVRGMQPRIAFLFTGQGAQYPGMGRELWATSATARRALEECAELLRPHLDRDLIELVRGDIDGDVLRQTCYAQPALFAVEYALAQFWLTLGVRPFCVAGHSLGEYVAAVIAGVMSLEDALPLVALRGRLMQELPSGGAMAAVLTTEERVRAALQGAPDVSIAAINGPENTVISGPASELDALIARLADDGVQCKSLHVSHAFHSALMDPMLDRFQEAVARIRLSAPTIPLIANLSGDVLTAEEAADPVRWRRHVREPVQFAPSLQRMHALGARTFIEVGPHPALSAIGASTIRDADVRWLASMRRGRSAWLQLMDTTGALWQHGEELDAAAFAREHGGRKTIAPTYAFQREPFWFTDGLEATRTASRPAHDRVHPLLRAALQSPVFDGWVFPATPETAGYLRDHVVGEHVLLPGAASVEMMLAAARLGPGWDSVTLRDLTFEQPLVIDDATEAQVILAAPVDSRARVRLVARRDEEWATIASAMVECVSDESADDEDIEALRRTHDMRFVVQDVYEGLTRLGLRYGPSFRTLVDASRATSSALGRVELTTGSTVQDHLVHPALLDGALHLLSALVGNEDATSTFLPAGADAVHFHKAAGRACYALASVRPQLNADEVSADVVLLDDRGARILTLQGFRARRMRAPIRMAGLDNITYVVEWEPVRVEHMDTDGEWVVVGSPGAAQDVANLLGAAGATVVGSGPVDEAVNLISMTGAAQVVYVLTSDDVIPNPTGSASDEIAASLNTVATLLSRNQRPRRLRLFVQTPAGDPAWRAAAMTALTPAIRAEYPELDIRAVDVDQPGEETIATALLGGMDEDRVAVRDGAILAPRLVRASDAREHPPAQPTRPVRRDAAYIVTGAGGGIGRALADWLSKQGAGGLILNGRSAPDEEWLATLRGRGVVTHWVRGDISERSTADALVARATERGLRLGGVFHAAGILDDALIETSSLERVTRVVSPKVDGALNLHAATERLALDHFVLFSSTAAWLAGPGQAAYAAANAALEAIAEWRHRSGHRSLCIHWGAWAGNGMMARLGQREIQTLEASGLAFLTADTGLAALERLMRDATRQVVAIAEVKWDLIHSATRQRPLPLFRHVLASKPGAADAAEGTAPISVRPLVDLHRDEQESHALEFVVHSLATVLRLRAASIAADTVVATLGFDSLMAMELRNRIEAGLDVLVPVATLLQAETPRAMADAVIAHARPALSPSNAGAEPLEVLEF